MLRRSLICFSAISQRLVDPWPNNLCLRAYKTYIITHTLWTMVYCLEFSRVARKPQTSCYSEAQMSTYGTKSFVILDTVLISLISCSSDKKLGILTAAKISQSSTRLIFLITICLTVVKLIRPLHIQIQWFVVSL